MLDLSRVLPLVKEFCQKDSNIQVLYLFGSYTDGTAHPKSDLDLAFLFKDDIGLWAEMALQAKLSETTGFEKIDTLNLNKAPLRMKFKALSTGRLIYEADPDRTTDFLEEVLLLYHDQEYRYKQFFKEWDEGLKEDYLDGQS
jgi:uncharacterized protein